MLVIGGPAHQEMVPDGLTEFVALGDDRAGWRDVIPYQLITVGHGGETWRCWVPHDHPAQTKALKFILQVMYLVMWMASGLLGWC